MKQHILVLAGISGSGKTTEARMLCATKHYIRVNRDDLREMLFGYTEEDIDEYYSRPGIQYREALVSAVQDKIIREALKAKRSVIIDNTNLKQKYLKEFNKYGVPVEYKLIDTDLNVAIERDSNRKRTVGQKVIEKQYKNLESLKKSGIFANN